MTSEDKIHALKLIKLKIEPPTDNRLGWLETWIHKEDLEAFDSAIKALEQEPTTKNDLGVDCIDRAELLKAMDTWDKFGDDPNKGLIPLRTPTLQDRYVPYVKYDDMINCVKGMQPVIPQEPKWIPVSERLPKPFMYVNATCRSLVDDREDWVVETIYLPIPKEANKHGYSDWGNIPMLNWGEAEVIAWMERIIPEPYKAESED